MTVEFMSALDYFMWIYGYWYKRIQYGGQAVYAYKKLGDERSLAWRMVYTLSYNHFALGNYDEAERYAEEARQIAQQIGDLCSIAYALRILGKIARERSHYERSRCLFEESIELWRDIEDIRVRPEEEAAWTKIDLGALMLQLGDYSDAQRLYQESRRVFEKIRNYSGISGALCGLGKIARMKGNFDEAGQLYQEALAVAEKINRLDAIAETKFELALLEEHWHHHAQVLRLAKEAIEIYERLGVSEGLEETRELVERLEHEMAEGTKDTKDAR